MRRVWLSDGPAVSKSIELIAELAPARQVTVPAVPIHYLNVGSVVEGNLRFLFEQDIKTAEPAVSVYRLRGAILLGSGVIVTTDGFVISDSFGPYHRAADINEEYARPGASTFVNIGANDDVMVGFRRLQRVAGAHFNLRDHGEAGYFHYLNAVMPAALIWKQRYPGLRPYYSQTADFQGGYFDMLMGRDRSQALRAVGSSVYFDELVVVAGLVRPDLRSGGFYERPRLAVELLRDFAAPLPRGNVERLYISRRDTSIRPTAGESELEEMLEREFGFTPVQLTPLGVAEQISLFKGSRVIVGLHGAGLSNIAYAAPGSKVIEIFPPTRIWPTFRGLAGRAEHLYAAIVLDTPEIDIARLRPIIAEIGW